MPSSKSIYRIFYFIAVVLFLAFIIITIQDLQYLEGWILMLSLVSLAIAFRGNKALRGLSYTVVILASLSLAMYYPQYFKTI